MNVGNISESISGPSQANLQVFSLSLCRSHLIIIIIIIIGRFVSAPITFVSDDAPTLGEVRRAIRKLRNGRAARSDGIQPELLKYAEEPVSTSLHSLFAQVWKSGLVPAEWRERIIVSLYKGRETTAVATARSPCFPFPEKCLPMYCLLDSSHY